MRWKILLTVAIVLAVVGLLVGTGTGRKYTEFLRDRMEGFVSLLTGFMRPSGEEFTLSLSTNMDAFLGQKYNVINSSLAGSGIYNYMKVGNQVINLKEGKRIDLFVDNMKGIFEITRGGSIKISADSDYMEIGDMTFSGQIKVDIEFIPEAFLLTELNQNKISLSSVTGEVKRTRGDKTDVASLEGDNVDINGFIGSLKLSDDGTMLSGLAVSVIGEKFTFA